MNLWVVDYLDQKLYCSLLKLDYILKSNPGLRSCIFCDQKSHYLII